MQEYGFSGRGALESGLAQSLDRGNAFEGQDRAAQPLDFGQGGGRPDLPVRVVNDKGENRQGLFKGRGVPFVGLGSFQIGGTKAPGYQPIGYLDREHRAGSGQQQPAHNDRPAPPHHHPA